MKRIILGTRLDVWAAVGAVCTVLVVAIAAERMVTVAVHSLLHRMTSPWKDRNVPASM